MSKSKQYDTIAYSYYCKACSKFYKYILDFDERLKPYACPKCHEQLKYKGGCSIKVSATGNCGYVSFEKQSEANNKEVGRDELTRREETDPVYGWRKKSREEGKKLWYRQVLDDPSKPLPLDKVKDLDKYIETGEKD